MPTLSKLTQALSNAKIPLAITAGFGGVGFAIYLFRMIQGAARNGLGAKSGGLGIKLTASKKSEKVSIDMKFLRNLMKLLRICIPGFFTVEMAYLTVVAFALIARTYCDLWMITNGTAIESSIIDRDPKAMWEHVRVYANVIVYYVIYRNVLSRPFSI